jgi:hypothetical protein
MDAQRALALENAANALVQLNAAKQSGDANAINQASQAVDTAVTPILHYVGTA